MTRDVNGSISVRVHGGPRTGTETVNEKVDPDLFQNGFEPELLMRRWNWNKNRVWDGSRSQ